MQYSTHFQPAAMGSLIGVQRSKDLVPSLYYRVAQVFAIPTLSLDISASANNEAQTGLQIDDAMLVQWRYRVTVASAQVVLRHPQAVQAYGTRSAKGYVSTNTATDWGPDGSQGGELTEFWVWAKDNISFDELAGTAANSTRFSGWKYVLQTVGAGCDIEKWAVRDPYTGRRKTVDPLELDPVDLPLLENFYGPVMLEYK